MPYKTPKTYPHNLNFYCYMFEKAYAERVKGFLNIEKMGIEHILFDITGAPTKVFRHYEIELISSQFKIDIPSLDLVQIEKEWNESLYPDKYMVVKNFLKHCLKRKWIVMVKAHKNSQEFRPGYW